MKTLIDFQLEQADLKRQIKQSEEAMKTHIKNIALPIIKSSTDFTFFFNEAGHVYHFIGSNYTAQRIFQALDIDDDFEISIELNNATRLFLKREEHDFISYELRITKHINSVEPIDSLLSIDFKEFFRKVYEQQILNQTFQLSYCYRETKQLEVSLQDLKEKLKALT